MHIYHVLIIIWYIKVKKYKRNSSILEPFCKNPNDSVVFEAYLNLLPVRSGIEEKSFSRYFI